MAKFIYPYLYFAIRGLNIPIKGIGNKKAKQIKFSEFESAVNATLERRKTKKKRPRISESQRPSGFSNTPYYRRKESSGNLYEDFEYGLSDW